MNSHGESSWEGQKAICVCSGLVGGEGDPHRVSMCRGSEPMESLEHSQILFGSPRAPSEELLVIFFVFSLAARFLSKLN